MSAVAAVPRGTIEERRAAKAAYDRARYAANPGLAAEYARRRRERDPEGQRERIRAWRLANPEQARAQRRRWLAADATRRQAVSAAITANGRAAKWGAPGRIAYRDVVELWEREPVCVDCGSGRGVDHVVPLSRGGANEPANLANRCHGCNNRKGVSVR